MSYALYLIPLTLITFLTVWVLAICKTLREEHSYIWLVLLVILPPIGIILFIINFYVLDDQKNGLSAILAKQKAWQRIAELKEELRERDIPGVREELAGQYFNLGHWKECLQNLQPALDNDPENLSLQYRAAQTLIALDEFEKALPHLQFIVDEDPRYRNWEAMLMLARLYEQLGDKKNAFHYFDELAKNVQRPEMLFHYARAYWGTEREEDARQVLRHMVESYDQDDQAYPRQERKWVEEARKLLQQGKS